MNTIIFTLLLAHVVALLLLPRKNAVIPLLTGAFYITLNQGINLGPFHFTFIRILIFVGITRIIMRREYPCCYLVKMDIMVIAFGLWAIFSSLFHQDVKSSVIFRLGLAYNTLGIYFIVRCFCKSSDDVIYLVKTMALLLVPVAMEMLIEIMIKKNAFSIINGGIESVTIRGDRYRARGPFAHPILAGTIGACSIPLIYGILEKYPKVAKIGIIACLTMVITSASSGPLMSLFAGLFGIFNWRTRNQRKYYVPMFLVIYLALTIIMTAPAYYLIARIDLVGGSTGWHRAALIEAAIKHINEWWFAGTDSTRHWMPTGVTWSSEHTDITNYYIKLGVIGGLPLMVMYIIIIWIAFKYIGLLINEQENSCKKYIYMAWCFGCGLFSHAVTGISVSYFDQSHVFVVMNIAIISSLVNSKIYTLKRG